MRPRNQRDPGSAAQRQPCVEDQLLGAEAKEDAEEQPWRRPERRDHPRHGDAEAGPFSERYVFPDGEPIHLSRVLLALERAGFVTEHVEGFASDYAETTRQWAERFEARYDDAVRIAGAERARVWRLYLHAAKQGFETGFESVYQVRCRRP